MWPAQLTTSTLGDTGIPGVGSYSTLGDPLPNIIGPVQTPTTPPGGSASGGSSGSMINLPGGISFPSSWLGGATAAAAAANPSSWLLTGGIVLLAVLLIVVAAWVILEG